MNDDMAVLSTRQALWPECRLALDLGLVVGAPYLKCMLAFWFQTEHGVRHFSQGECFMASGRRGLRKWVWSRVCRTIWGARLCCANLRSPGSQSYASLHLPCSFLFRTSWMCLTGPLHERSMCFPALLLRLSGRASSFRAAGAARCWASCRRSNALL